jgi:cysteine desulfurase
MERVRSLRDRLERRLLEAVPEARVNGHPRERLPNTLSISFPGLASDALLAALPQVAASAGAACHSDTVKISHVLEAMGLDPEAAKGTLRLSLGRFTDQDDVDRAAEEIARAVRTLRKQT